MAPWNSEQYRVYLLKCMDFCHNKNLCPMEPTISSILDFLTKLFDDNLGYSAINTARSALSSVVNIMDSPFTVGNHPLVQRLMKAIFNTRPSLPRYQQTWEVKTVLNFLKNVSPAKKLTLKELSEKLAILCMLVTSSRGQTIVAMDTNTMLTGKSSYKFPMDQIVKQSRPGKPQPVLVLPAYPADRRLCVVTYLREYLERTKNIRNSNRLFVSYCKPHNSITIATLSRWVRNTLQAAGIDTNVFKMHSTRVASTSAAKAINVPVDTIMKTAGWSQQCTFRKYYDKQIVKPGVDENYGVKILDTNNIANE